MLKYINYIMTSLYMLNTGKKTEARISREWPEIMVDEFRSLLGRGESEIAGNNRGPFLDRIRRQSEKHPRDRVYGAWCAAAVLYACQRSWAIIHNLNSWDYLSDRIKGQFPLPQTFGARKLWKKCCKNGARIKNPEVGALVLWARGAKGSWEAHIGVVTKVNEVTGEWWYIAGNEGRVPAVIKESLGNKKRRLIGFARLPKAPVAPLHPLS